MGSNISGSRAGHALFLIYESIFPISPIRPIGCLSKPRCWIQALTPASGALAGPQPIAPPRPFSCEDVIFLFLSPALPPPSLSLSSFSFLIPLSSPPPLLFSHRYVPLALKGIGFPPRTPPSHFRLSTESVLSPSFLGFSADKKCSPVLFFPSSSRCLGFLKLNKSAPQKNSRNDFSLAERRQTHLKGRWPQSLQSEVMMSEPRALQDE